MERRHFVGLAGAAALARPRVLEAHDDAPASGAAAAQEDPRLAGVFRLIEARQAEYGVPGVAFGFYRRGVEVTRGFGLTNLSNPQPVTPDTVFPSASISKTMVSTALMRLADEGRVDVEAPVRAYLPDFRVADEELSREVRIWHLLTHTPGWEGQLGTPDRGERTLADFAAGLTELPKLADPGDVWSYNNAGFGIAGRVLEVVTGSDIGEALAELVFRPLALTHAFTRTGEAMTHRFAAGHRDRGGRTEVIHRFRLPANVSAGGAAMSVASMIRYARFHLGDGAAPDGRRLLSRASLGAMRAARIVKRPSTDRMGLGWHLRTLDGVETAAHGGTLGGHCLHVQLVPERDLAFSILTNHNRGWRLISDVERFVLETYEGLRHAPAQRTGGNRGGNEDMRGHAEPLDPQPDLSEYVGRYQRPPSGEGEMGAVDGRLVIQSGGTVGDRLVFWAPDMAFIEGSGIPYEFVRDGAGAVRWMRMNGRIGRKA